MSLVQLPSGSLQKKPPQHQLWSEHYPDLLSAYDLAIHAESHAEREIESKPKDKEAQGNLVSARFVGRMLIELFDLSWSLTEAPWRRLSMELRSNSQEHGSADENVFRLGKWYREHLIRMFRTSTAKYPTPSLHPSRPSFDTKADITKDRLEADGTDYRTVRLKALARDNYRCIVTGFFDETSIKQSDQLAQICSEHGVPFTTLNACHILSASTMKNVDPIGNPTSDKIEFAASALTILECFGLKDHVEKLLPGGGVHDIRNLLSLEYTCHTYFDKLNLWFERSKNVPGRYYVCVPQGGYEHAFRQNNYLATDDRGRRYTTFSQTQTSIGPDPKLLGLHAVCARVAHMSGAAEVFDELEREVEATRVLAFDGSSARLLNHVLTPLSSVRGVA